MSILKIRSPKSYNLPAVHIVGKVSFGKLTLVKFGIFAAPKNEFILVKKCISIRRVV